VPVKKIHYLRRSSEAITTVPVRMFLKASSTFVESRAEVSIKDKLFFSVINNK